MPKRKSNNPTNRPVKKAEPGIPGNEASVNVPEDEKLQKELQWCIEQLRLGLMTQKSSQQQVQESVRIIKILSSKTAPLVKKRQIMRQTFGDYRKKIEEENARWIRETQRLEKKVAISDPLTTKSGVFLRHRNQVSDEDGSLEKVFQKCSMQEDGEETQFTGRNERTIEESNQEFKFNFRIEEKTCS